MTRKDDMPFTLGSQTLWPVFPPALSSRVNMTRQLTAPLRSSKALCFAGHSFEWPFSFHNLKEDSSPWPLPFS